MQHIQLKQLTITLFTLCVATFSGMKAAEAASFSVVADGLNNARGLSFGPDGALYVTEAGTGGNGACVSSVTGQGSLCYGATGRVLKIQNGQTQTALSGLPSIALADGSNAGGARDIQFDATGKPYILLGYGTNPSFRSSLGDVDLGKIITADFETNSWTTVADISNYELVNNPDGSDLNSNPLGLYIDGDRLLVVDAGANDLLSVEKDGSNLQALTVFPEETLTNPTFPPDGEPSTEPGQVPTPTEEPPSELSVQVVPSSVVKGPDGAYYVSQFTGFPFAEGEAKIFRVGTDGKTTVYADGFTHLTDLEFDSDGNLYALQYANQSAWKGNVNGSLIKITPDGKRKTILSGNGLESPNALTIGGDGAIYISNRSDRPGQGQIIRIDHPQSVPEPTAVAGIVAFSIFSVGSLRHQKRNTNRTKTLPWQLHTSHK
ncbi:ScyD/ScyE family protein [Anabaena azotica]|uniref:ScyD/ScyE family protein n=1 Tax=Anabaena azotica FACHB-119 TaxID=947527 RepID=A0ABR8CYZ5_9NOST|nr:ScyD/ScyE family protein [Anabaena azotica]MBD2500169.1 ScyD/ScyE family protein [Anabaena azotica FACHB-119]